MSNQKPNCILPGWQDIVDGRCPSLRTPSELRGKKQNARRVAWVEHRSTKDIAIIIIFRDEEAE
jgi:hypothetical protein